MTKQQQRELEAYKFFDRKVNNFVKWFAKEVPRQLGKRCKEYVRHCVVCDFYRALDELNSLGFYCEPVKKK